MQRTFYIKSLEHYEKWIAKAKARNMSVSAYLQWLVDEDDKTGIIMKELFKRQS